MRCQPADLNEIFLFLFLCFCFSLVVSELQEEGINAINLPLSPSHYELDPEDTMLGKPSHFAKAMPKVCESALVSVHIYQMKS